MKRRGTRKMRWTTLSAIALMVREGDRALSIICHIDPEGLLKPEPGGILAVALESDATLPAPVFGAHAHDVVGRFDRMSEAEKACETYAKQWIKKQKALPTCGCGPIK